MKINFLKKKPVFESDFQEKLPKTACQLKQFLESYWSLIVLKIYNKQMTTSKSYDYFT